MSRTTTGRDFVSDALFKDTSRPNAALIMALGDANVAVPAQGSNTHTTMGGNTSTEATADGFARALAVYTHTTGAQTSTLQKTFTNSAASGANPHTIYEVALFSPTVAATPGAANTGILVFETTEPNPPVLTGTDSVNQTVTVDFGV
jgi:hypothetical protein